MQRNLVTVNITVVDVIWTSDQKIMVANVEFPCFVTSVLLAITLIVDIIYYAEINS